MNLKPNAIFDDQSQAKSYMVVSQIGKGKFRVVYLVEELQTRQKFALKVQTQITEQELSLLEQLVKKKPTNLVNIISYGEYLNMYPYQIMEYCKENLYETITQKGTIKNEQFRYVAHQISTGLGELHNLGLIHRNIKPENIMQFEHQDQVTKTVQKTYKICDFDLVMYQDIAETQFIGEIYYLAPEQLNPQATYYSNKVDIWALGAVFYELVKGEPLFFALTQKEIYELILQAKIDDKIQNLPLKPECIQLIQNMLNRDPYKRPCIQEVIRQLSSSISMKPTIVHQVANPIGTANTIGTPNPQHIQSRQQQQQQIDLINQFQKKNVENQNEQIGKPVVQVQKQQIKINKNEEIFNLPEQKQQQNQQVQPRREINLQEPTMIQNKIKPYYSPQPITVQLIKNSPIKNKFLIKPNQNDIFNQHTPTQLRNQEQSFNHQQELDNKRKNLTYFPRDWGQLFVQQEQKSIHPAIVMQQINQQPQPIQQINQQQKQNLTPQQRAPRLIGLEVEPNKINPRIYLSPQLGEENKNQQINKMKLNIKKDPNPFQLQNQESTLVHQHGLPQNLLEHKMKNLNDFSRDWGQLFEQQEQKLIPPAIQMQQINQQPQPIQQTNSQQKQNLTPQQRAPRQISLEKFNDKLKPKILFSPSPQIMLNQKNQQVNTFKPNIHNGGNNFISPNALLIKNQQQQDKNI